MKDNSDSHFYKDKASVFRAHTPILPNSTSLQEGHGCSTLCRGGSWYEAGLARYSNNPAVPGRDVHHSTYHSTSSFMNGIQEVASKSMADTTDTPMITAGEVVTFLSSSNQDMEVALFNS